MGTGWWKWKVWVEVLEVEAAVGVVVEVGGRHECDEGLRHCQIGRVGELHCGSVLQGNSSPRVDGLELSEQIGMRLTSSLSRRQPLQAAATTGSAVLDTQLTGEWKWRGQRQEEGSMCRGLPNAGCSAPSRNCSG